MSLVALAERVRRTIRHHQMAGVGARVVAATSGGADSVALARILHTLSAAGHLHLIALAHLNHQLRPDAAADEAFCRRLATELGVAFVSESVAVAETARRERCSIEDAAHRERHAFFERVRLGVGADVVAVGHTMDDQAETVLLRMLRGAGSRGLGGMHPRAGSVIRPLLDCRREELRALLTAAGAEWVHDATNDDVAIPRNRVRAELLPLLAERFNPRIVEGLARQSAVSREDERFLRQVADDWWRDTAEPRPDGWAVPVDALIAAPAAIARRSLHRALARLSGGRPVGAAHVDRAWAVVSGEAPAADGPGHRVERLGGTVVLSGKPPGTRGRATSGLPVQPFRVPLPVPGEARLPGMPASVTADIPGDGCPDTAGTSSIAVVPLVLLQGSVLAVRNRRPGDRLRIGRQGHRKVQDLLVDRKVPRADRDRVPIVVDGADRIIWVAGHVLDWDFRVTDPAQGVVILRLIGTGGSC